MSHRPERASSIRSPRPLPPLPLRRPALAESPACFLEVLGGDAAELFLDCDLETGLGVAIPGGVDGAARSADRQRRLRGQSAGIKMIGCTLTPYHGAGYYTENGEAIRKAVNDWIRTSGAYDGVIDFDAAIRDPQHPTRYLAAFDSGDHLHPNDAGYKAMGDAIDLTLFAQEKQRKKH